MLWLSALLGRGAGDELMSLLGLTFRLVVRRDGDVYMNGIAHRLHKNYLSAERNLLHTAWTKAGSNQEEKMEKWKELNTLLIEPEQIANPVAPSRRNE